jgi:hypothetical protein
MSAIVVTPPLTEPVDMASGLAARILRQFKVQVEDWYDVCRQLTNWEAEHLLDNPTVERRAEHARLLDELERVGQWLLLLTQGDGFPDKATAELVAMTLQDLRDRRALWHGNMPPEQASQIVSEVFGES